MIGAVLDAFRFFVARPAVGLVRGFFGGGGYKPRNDVLEGVKDQCANLPAGQQVRLPWLHSGDAVVPHLNDTGRLLAYTAIASGWFGLTERVSGRERDYRYYYRQDMTGNWFAEIWSVWKSSFWAALLIFPYFGWANRAAEGRSLDDHVGFILLMMGALLMLFFLPRAILGQRGAHLAAISLINKPTFNYSAAQVVNWLAGLTGVSFVWMSFGLEWHPVEALSFLFSKVYEVLNAVFGFNDDRGVFGFLRDVLIVFVGLPVAGIALASFIGACFWAVSLRFRAFREAKAQLLAVGYNDNQANMFNDGTFSYATSVVMPQIALGSLIHTGLMFYILFPIFNSAYNLFFG
ncbi:hypothetical protein QM298_22685 [Pseudomonas mendocina]|nr:hypothetical protein [Pseudomonas mendocina]MDV5863632.1 hypothetical protein [Pseudomonas mendocina]